MILRLMGLIVSPAHAGIDPRHHVPRSDSGRFPRARGDRPIFDSGHAAPLLFPPRTRGSTARAPRRQESRSVSPAHAGIDRAFTGLRFVPFGFPRARGDRPLAFMAGKDEKRFPPRTRGSTPSTSSPAPIRAVSPAHAGIDLRLRGGIRGRHRFPRARGDRPEIRIQNLAVTTFPPRTRGSTLVLNATGSFNNVSPAHAGIDPKQLNQKMKEWGFPRARGDRPKKNRPPYVTYGFPPRTRGSTRWRPMV